MAERLETASSNGIGVSLPLSIRPQRVGRAREQLDHHREAVIGGFLEAVEGWLARVTGLPDLISPGFDEFPESLAERGRSVPPHSVQHRGL